MIMRRTAKHMHRELTADERKRVAAARAEADRDKPEILRKARRYKQEADAARATLQEALQMLKRERESQGLSLADIQKRTGIEPPNLSRLENEAEANPTIATLTRYAEALGKRLMIVLADNSSATSAG
jgi:DNA-binding phage protein